MRIVFLLSTLFIVSAGIVLGQTPTERPTREGDNPREVFTVRRADSINKLPVSEVEPRSKKFQMKIKFLRAKYSRPVTDDRTWHVYEWDYFDEAIIAVQFLDGTKGRSINRDIDREQLVDKLLRSALSAAKAEKLSEKAVTIGDARGKQIEVKAGDAKIIARAFARGEEVYMLAAQLHNEDAVSKIEELFDSFSFVSELQ